MKWLRKKLMRQFTNWISVMDKETKAISRSLQKFNITAIVSMKNKLYLSFAIPKTNLFIQVVL